MANPALNYATPDDAGLAQAVNFSQYVELLAYIERLHRLMLDVIKDEFERIGVIEVNSVQALLLFNIGESELTAGELKSRGYYQGSNVSYNLKKLVEGGYVHHQRCDVDRRAVRISLTEKGRDIRDVIAALYQKHVGELPAKSGMDAGGLHGLLESMRQIERYWTDQIRYIY